VILSQHPLTTSKSVDKLEGDLVVNAWSLLRLRRSAVSLEEPTGMLPSGAMTRLPETVGVVLSASLGKLMPTNCSVTM
jgi:hypothetical protein